MKWPVGGSGAAGWTLGGTPRGATWCRDFLWRSMEDLENAWERSGKHMKKWGNGWQNHCLWQQHIAKPWFIPAKMRIWPMTEGILSRNWPNPRWLMGNHPKKWLIISGWITTLHVHACTTDFSQKKDDSPYERGHEMIEALGIPTNYCKTTQSFELLGSFVGMSEWYWSESAREHLQISHRSAMHRSASLSPMRGLVQRAQGQCLSQKSGRDTYWLKGMLQRVHKIQNPRR